MEFLLSLAEAMAMKLPVISTDIVGISELVHSGAGILIQPHHPEELSRALEEISAMSPQERDKMGQRGRSVVDSEFNLIKGVQKLSEIFRREIEEKGLIQEQSVMPQFSKKKLDVIK